MYQGLEFEAERGERIVLVGPNGAGKSTLLKLLDAPYEPWRNTVNDLGWFVGYRKHLVKPPWSNSEMAQTGLAILGPLAQPVLPELLTRLSLARTTDHRSFIVGYIAAIGPAAEAAIPDLMKLARSGGQDERSYATIALGEIGRRPEIAVPFLTDQLADPDRHIRFVAMKTLEKFSTNAVSATPAFVKLLTDPETSVRETATNTLRLINPAAAAAAGIK